MTWTTGRITISTDITIGITVAVTTTIVAIVSLAIGTIAIGTIAIGGAVDPGHSGASRKTGGAYGSGCVSQSGGGNRGRPGG
jgi:hypothetical protein